jgi:hypothetical protein
VATFYVLPPRALVGDAVADLLHDLLPGLSWAAAARACLADLVVAAALTQPEEAYVIFRDDLPAGEPLPRALADGFGAEPGDEVVEVRPGAVPGQLSSRRWRLEGRQAA